MNEPVRASFTNGGHVRVDLHEGWTVSATGGEGVARLPAGLRIPATVPGCVHLDLLAAGLIPDPYLDENEADVAWVGRTDWTYCSTLSWAGPPDGEPTRLDLVADGLDTVAEVRLNGQVVAATRNMHRSYRIDVTGLLTEGENRLAVAFRAPLAAAEAAAAELGSRPHVNTHPYNALRKNASSFGWDWGPDLPSSGIWRPIGLEAWSVARLAGVRPLVEVRADGTGVLTVATGIEWAGVAAGGATAAATGVLLRASIAGRTAQVQVPAAAASATLTIEVPEVPLWWPRGYGAQPLHDVLVELVQDDVVLAAHRTRVGFRTVALDQGDDDRGTSFTVLVNGVRILVRGFNWIPDDAFPSRVDRRRYEARLRQAYDANANLLRVWGGGLYESEDFYAVCDELGLLVWQDFLFACAAYAEEAPQGPEVVAEAREAVVRLSSHPSLALWCGGNECLWGYDDWGWQPELAGRSWGSGFYRSVLPAIVAELDPTRPYIPGSPFSPRAELHPNDPAHGPMHIWDVWNQRDYTGYLSYEPRFVSEFGFQGPPTWSTLTRAVHDSPLTPDSPGMLAHQKAEDGNGKLARGLEGHLPEPSSMQDWHWATSLNQARAVALGVEHFRALAPVCTGAIVWQLNDCWPATSWSVVDGDGRRKPVWYALRRSFHDRLLVVRRSGGHLELVAVNDTGEPWTAQLTAQRVAFDGTPLAKAALDLDVGARSTAVTALPDDLAQAQDPRRELVVVRGGAVQAYWWFAEDLAALLPEPAYDVTTRAVPGGYQVDVTARSLLEDLALLVDRVHPDAAVDDMLVTLLPGESVRFQVDCPAEVPVDAFAGPPVLRCANDLMPATADRGGGAAG